MSGYILFEVLTAVVMNSLIFWDITPCSPLKVNWCFGRTCRLHLQGRRISQARNHHEAGTSWANLPCCFMVVSFLVYSSNPEHGDGMVLRNVGWLSTDYTVLYPRRRNSSNVWTRSIQVLSRSSGVVLPFNAVQHSYWKHRNIRVDHVTGSNLRRHSVRECAGFIWFSIRTHGALSWAKNWTFGFCQSQGIPSRGK
jgi:hypothetical protein